MLRNQTTRQELNNTKQIAFRTWEEWTKADLLKEITRILQKVREEETKHTKEKDQL
jgi:hypothetical protein